MDARNRGCLWKLLRSERGDGLIEYALLIAFLAVTAGTVLPNVANSISAIMSNIATTLQGPSVAETGTPDSKLASQKQR